MRLPASSRFWGYCLPDSCIYVFLISRDFVPGYSRFARYWLPAKATDNQLPATNNRQQTTNNQLPTTNNRQPTTYHYSPFILSCRTARRLSEEVRDSFRRMLVRWVLTLASDFSRSVQMPLSL